MLRITINHDSDVNAPWKECDGSWRVASCDARSFLYENSTTFQTIGFKRKLSVGLAFPLSKYVHGGEVWSLRDEGTQCRFDTTTDAGFLIWDHSPSEMDAKTFEGRQADARQFLDVFNAWVNGECYLYRIERITECPHCESETIEEIDSCGGFIGADSLFAHLQDAMADYSQEEVEFSGDAKWLAEYHSVK